VTDCWPVGRAPAVVAGYEPADLAVVEQQRKRNPVVVGSVAELAVDTGVVGHERNPAELAVDTGLRNPAELAVDTGLVGHERNPADLAVDTVVVGHERNPADLAVDTGVVGHERKLAVDTVVVVGHERNPAELAVDTGLVGHERNPVVGRVAGYEPADLAVDTVGSWAGVTESGP